MDYNMCRMDMASIHALPVFHVDLTLECVECGFIQKILNALKHIFHLLAMGI